MSVWPVAVMPDGTRQKAIERYGPGLITIAQCTICGNLAWRSTAGAPESSVVVEPMSTGDDCGYCLLMCTRNPEIFKWVNDVVMFQLKRHGVG